MKLKSKAVLFFITVVVTTSSLFAVFGKSNCSGRNFCETEISTKIGEQHQYAQKIKQIRNLC